MSIFKNSVGRPSNDTLRKRKIFKISAIVGGVLLAGIGIFVGIRYSRGDMSSGLFNLSSSPVSITIQAVNENTGKQIEDKFKNKNVTLSGWRNYKVGFNVNASSTNGSIKKIDITWNNTGKVTTKDAEASIKANKKSVNGNKAYFDFTGDGIRYATVTATDNKGKTRTIKVRASLDRTAPTVKFKVQSGKQNSNGSYASGMILQATCSDSISGVTYMKTFDAQDTSDDRTYNGSAIKSKSHQITMVTEGAARNITTACKDKAGNSTGNKNSACYGIDMKPASKCSTDVAITDENYVEEVITKQNDPRVTVEVVNKSNNASLKTTRSGNSIFLSGWKNYKVRFKVSATSPEKGTTIKSIHWKWNKSGITSTTKSNYDDTVGGNKTFNAASANLDFNAEGARFAVVTVTDSKGRDVVFYIGANIDLTKPTVKLEWQNAKAKAAGGGKYYVGLTGKVTCTDSLSGVQYGSVRAREGLNKNNTVAGTTNSALVSLKTAGNNYFVGYCSDKAGNKSAEKKSNAHPIIKDYSISISVKGNPTSWTNKDVALGVTAKASKGLASKPYSFDGGKTWQTLPVKSFSKNQTVNIKVKDKNGNIESKSITIDKIDKELPTIKYEMLSKPSGNGIYSLKAAINATCKDNAQLKTMNVYEKGASWNGVYESNVGSKSKTIKMTFLNSNYKGQMYTSCTDAAGNKAVGYSKVYKINQR